MSKKTKQVEPAPVMQPLTELLRLPAGRVQLGALDSRATLGFEGGKADAPGRTLALEPELSELQGRLFAAGRAGLPGAPRVLVVLQGMETSVKGGVIWLAFGVVKSGWVRTTAFK